MPVKITPAVGDAGHRPALRDINVNIAVDHIDSGGASDPPLQVSYPVDSVIPTRIRARPRPVGSKSRQSRVDGASVLTLDRSLAPIAVIAKPSPAACAYG
jgi:hypothetical protein